MVGTGDRPNLLPSQSPVVYTESRLVADGKYSEWVVGAAFKDRFHGSSPQVNVFLRYYGSDTRLSKVVKLDSGLVKFTGKAVI